MLSSSLSAHRPLLAHLRALLPSSPDPTQPILPVSGESILGFPFKSLYDTSKGKIVGDMHLGITSNAFDEYPVTPEEVSGLIRDAASTLPPAVLRLFLCPRPSASRTLGLSCPLVGPAAH